MTHNPQQLSDAELIFLFTNASIERYEHYQGMIGAHLRLGVESRMYVYGPIVDGVLKLDRTEGYIHGQIDCGGSSVGGSIDSRFGDNVVKNSSIAVKIRAFIKQPWVVFSI